jgi:hypothetical protein
MKMEVLQVPRTTDRGGQVNMLKISILLAMKWKTKKLTLLQHSFNDPLNSCL